MPADSTSNGPTKCRRGLPDCIQECLDATDGLTKEERKWQEFLSNFSFPNPHASEPSPAPPLSPPQSPCTYAVTFECEDGISWEGLSPTQTPSSSVLQNSRSNSTSTTSYLQRRRSSQESTHIELDVLTDDVRRVRDGMKDSLNRYFSSTSFVAFYALPLYLKIQLPTWEPLERSLTQLMTNLTPLLRLVQNSFGVEECLDIGIRICPKLAGATQRGFTVLKLWNQCDERLQSEYHRNPHFVHMPDKKRRSMISKTDRQLVELKTLIDEIEKSTGELLLAHGEAEGTSDADVSKVVSS